MRSLLVDQELESARMSTTGTWNLSGGISFTASPNRDMIQVGTYIHILPFDDKTEIAAIM
jgi:hypothetical protein